MKLSGADAFVRMFKGHGVTHMFGLPGDSLGLYDAIFRDGAIRHVLVRHEQAAAHMADAYARVTGRVAVCDASSGPGVTNLVTALATAHADSIGVVAITTTSPTGFRQRGNFQELDQRALLGSIAKTVIEIDNPARVPELTKRAFRIASTGRPGVVVLNVPMDVFLGQAEFSDAELACDARFGVFPALRVRPADGEAKKVLELLRKAKKPVIWCGGGVVTAGASLAIQALAEATGVPVTTTYMGKGSLPENHPLSLGPAGLLGRPMTNKYLADVDLVLAIGTRFTNVDTANWNIPKRGTAIVQVDIDPAELGKNYDVLHSVWADAKLFAEELAALAAQGPKITEKARAEVSAIRAAWLAERGPDSAQAQYSQDEPVHPLQAMRALREAMGPEDTLICDSGFNQIWGGQYFEVTRPGRSYVGPRGMGTMGFAFPAAIGAKIAEPNRRFVALAGDGGFMMLVHELETAVRMKTPVVVCVLNNRSLEYCKAAQTGLLGQRYISTDLGDSNFAEIAKAFGAHGVRVTRSAELPGVLKQALDSDVVTVVEVITPDVAKPDGVPF
ncbi:MAG: thiamine pyrophosphate-binding protein [Proteobacteria bacterium]|nr:thiamine pyrophosphate-binding protein [Pseudomonadota bacterium]